MSESISESESASASAAALNIHSNSPSENGGGSRTDIGFENSASEINDVAPATTNDSFNEIVDDKTLIRTVRYNEVETLENQRVSLAVVLDDDLLKAEDVVVINDSETPLGVAKAEMGGRNWWYWILILISAITGKVAKEKRLETQNSVSDK